MENQKPTYSTLKEEPIQIHEKPVGMPTPSHPHFKHMPKKTAAILLILILIMFGIGGTWQILQLDKQANITDFESCAAAGNPVAESYPATCRDGKGNVYTQELTDEEKKNLIPPTEDWSTYTDSSYGFSFQYPTNGEVIDANGQMSPGTCGSAIKRQYISTYPYVLGVDNFFNITAQPFNGTIQQYMNSYGGSSLFDVKQIKVSGADEAVEISKKSNADPQTLMKSPFAYTDRIYKKGNNIFTVMLLQNYGNTGGCVPHDNIAIDEILNTLTFENSSPTCTPRPNCLDSIPACKIPETEDMCPPTSN
jgi:hypothetical protein